jgi:hypothetical protein
MASIIYICNLCNFLAEDCTEIFFTIYKWNISSIHRTMGLRRSTAARKVESMSLIFISFNILALTIGLH